MCTGLEPLLIGSLAASVGGTALSASKAIGAQNAQNRQIDANNRRLEDQFNMRRQQEEAARQRLTRLSDQGNQQQKDFVAQKEAALTHGLDQFSRPAVDSAHQAAVDNRMNTFNVNDLAYNNTPIGQGGPRIIQDNAAKSRAAAANETQGSLGGLANLGALGDVGTSNSIGLSDIAKSLNDIAAQAKGQSNISNSSIADLNRGIANSANRPYETVPLQPKNGSSIVGSLLSGLGQLGSTAAFYGKGAPSGFPTNLRPRSLPVALPAP
ncbi:MAG TPA: hypothetical protein VKA19_01260 [Alphaproteobacteria bacterium]|nr:hypothetical protein [Alphaproteobacteria bacterium]